MFNSSKGFIVFILIFLAGVYVFTRNLSVHGLEYRDDEIFYYQSSQEMVSQNNYLSPTYFGEHRFQKPILFYWFIILFYKILGVSWFSARLVSSLFAALTVSLTWLLARKLFNSKTAILSAVIVATIPLFFRHAKNAVPDMALNFFIVLALYSAIEFINNPENRKYAYGFFIACALGFMVKGVAAVAVPLMTIILYCLITHKKAVLKKFNFMAGMGIFILITAPWFIYMIKVYGKMYLDYMLVHETQGRIIGVGSKLGIVQLFRNFVEHYLFYLKVIFNYFAPWSIFFFIGVGICIRDVRKKVPEAQELIFLLIWVGVVYMIFSSMKFLINHYMLVLSTPFAVIVSYFLLHRRDANAWWGSKIYAFKKGFSIFIFVLAYMAFSFLVLFLIKSNVFVALALGIGFIWLMKIMITTHEPLTRSLVLGLFILFVFAQSNLLFKAGIVSHATLEKFAETVLKDQDKNYVIGVGSHDIHEKEFQVHFDKPVVKAATSLDHETFGLLTKLFNNPEEVYCLFIKNDFDVFLTVSKNQKVFEIVQKDMIMRRRMKLDLDFVKALVQFNRNKVEGYLKEEIILVKKAKNDSE